MQEKQNQYSVQSRVRERKKKAQVVNDVGETGGGGCGAGLTKTRHRNSTDSLHVLHVPYRTHRAEMGLYRVSGA